MLKVNSISYNPSLLNVKTNNAVKPLLPKYNLNSDTVSFSSLAIFKKKSFWQKALQLLNPKPTPGEIAVNMVKYFAQGLSIIGSSIAIFSLSK